MHGPLNVKFTTGIHVFGVNDTWTTLNIQVFDERRDVFGCVFYDIPNDRGAVISVSGTLTFNIKATWTAWLWRWRNYTRLQASAAK